MIYLQKEYSDVRGDKHVKFELQKLKRMKINLENIIAYIQGNKVSTLL